MRVKPQNRLLAAARASRDGRHAAPSLRAAAGNVARSTGMPGSSMSLPAGSISADGRMRVSGSKVHASMPPAQNVQEWHGACMLRHAGMSLAHMVSFHITLHDGANTIQHSALYDSANSVHHITPYHVNTIHHMAIVIMLYSHGVTHTVNHNDMGDIGDMT